MEEQKAGAPDRVWFSSDLKMNLGDYQSASASAGMSSDVQPGETIAQAFERVRKDVERTVLQESVRIRNGVYRKAEER